MDMTGEYRIEAPRAKVWEALNDPEVLKRCIPGCEEIDKTSDTEFTARVSIKIGPVSAKFAGKVTLSDLDPPNGYKISGEGQGGVAGFANGGATVTLEDEGGATRLHYVVNANVGGKLAQIGARLIDSTARKLAKEFFAAFAESVAVEPLAGEPKTGEPVAVEPLAGETTTAPAEKKIADEAAEKRPALDTAAWVIAVIIVVAMLLLMFAA